MTEREAAAFLGIGYRTLMRLRRRGLVPYRRLPGVRRIIYDRDVLREWQNEQMPLRGGVTDLTSHDHPVAAMLARFVRPVAADEVRARPTAAAAGLRLNGTTVPEVLGDE